MDYKRFHEYCLSITEAQWIEWLKLYLVNGSYVCVRAFPSIEEQNRLSEEESTRIEIQRKQLGEDGLKEKARQLKQSKQLMDFEPPSSMTTEVAIPSIDNVNYHNLRVYKSNEVSNIENVFNFSEIPVYTEVYDVHTKFIFVNN